MKIDKQNGDVCFNDENHIYWNLKDNSKYISVTTLIERFGQPFDESFWSAYKALEKIMEPEAWKIERSKLLDTKKFDKSLLEIYDISENNFNKAQQDILDEWAETNRISCERGTKIHAILEHKMYDAGANITFKKLGIRGKFICNKGHLPLDIENGVYPEYLLHYDSPDGILKLAGQTDLLIKNGNDIYIGDYKTNKKIDTKSFFDKKLKRSQKMKYPLNQLDDCNFMHYTLQLSTYAWMVKQINPNFNIKDLILIHYDHNGKQTVYHCDYMEDKVLAMLKWYKKLLIHDNEKLKYKKIDY